MMIIAIFPNVKKPKAYELAIKVRDFFKSKDIAVVAADAHAASLQIPPFSTVAPSDISLVISLGGDGSILNFVHSHPEINAPIMGINLGSLGFLADVQERLMIGGRDQKETLSLAVNEVVVHRGENNTLIDLAVYVNGKHLNTFSADGVIVATPSGSTAYSLSAGGPIITPELDALVITPICPHTIINRPIVLRPESEITIQYLNDYQPAKVAFDGIYKCCIKPQHSFSVTAAKKRFRLAVLSNVDYFATLRSKLGWTGTLKN